MSYLTISSVDEKKKPFNTVINPSNMLITLTPALDLKTKHNEVALFSLFTYNTVRNIKTNNPFSVALDYTLEYTVNGVNHTVLVPDGLYGIGDVYALLQTSLALNGGYDAATNTYGITFVTNANTNKVDIVIDNTVNGSIFTFIMRDGTSNFFGFPIGAVVASGTSTMEPNVNAGINCWQVRCDLAQNSISNGETADILFSFLPTPSNAGPSQTISVEPLHLAYTQVDRSLIHNFRIQLTDQSGNILDLEGSEITYVISIRKMGHNSH